MWEESKFSINRRRCLIEKFPVEDKFNGFFGKIRNHLFIEFTIYIVKFSQLSKGIYRFLKK